MQLLTPVLFFAGAVSVSVAPLALAAERSSPPACREWAALRAREEAEAACGAADARQSDAALSCSPWGGGEGERRSVGKSKPVQGVGKESSEAGGSAEGWQARVRRSEAAAGSRKGVSEQMRVSAVARLPACEASPAKLLRGKVQLEERAV
jgi:hypothetical protein